MVGWACCVVDFEGGRGRGGLFGWGFVARVAYRAFCGTLLYFCLLGGGGSHTTSAGVSFAGSLLAWSRGAVRWDARWTRVE